MMPVFKKNRGGLTLFYKAIALILAVVMSFGALPVTAKAGETAGDQSPVIAEDATYSMQEGDSGEPNAVLSGLTLEDAVGGGALSLAPEFNPEQQEYRAESGASTAVKVTPTTAAPSAIIQVNGAAVLSGTASQAIDLVDGAAVVSIKVIDGVVSKTYTVSVVPKIDPFIAVDASFTDTEGNPTDMVTEWTYLTRPTRYLYYDCNQDEFTTIFKATLYPESGGTVKFKPLSQSGKGLYTFNPDTGVFTIDSERVYLSIPLEAYVEEDPSITLKTTFVFFQTINKSMPSAITVELPTDGNSYTYTVSADVNYVTSGGGLVWEFPANDYFDGAPSTSHLYRGTITPKRPGTANFFVIDEITKHRASIPVTITGTGVLTAHGGRAEAKLAGNGNPAEPLQLAAYGDEENDTFTWSSADESIAIVDQNGLVSPVSPGVTLIKATAAQTGISGAIKVTVRDDGARYLDSLQLLPLRASANGAFEILLDFAPNTFEYSLVCPEGNSTTYYGGLSITPTFNSEEAAAHLIYIDANGELLMEQLTNKTTLKITNFLKAGENELQLVLTEKSSRKETIYKFKVARPISQMIVLDGASLKPAHRDAAAYPRYTPPVEAAKPITQTVQEGVVYTVATKTGKVSEGIGSISYSGVFKDTSAIDLNIDKAMPKEAVVRVKNSLTGTIYPESNLTDIPLDDGDKTVFLIEEMSGKSAAENPDSFVVDASYTLTVYKLDMPPVDMSGVYFTSVSFSDGCILTTPPVAFDPQTTTSVKLLIPNQEISWVDVTLPEDVELYLGSVLPENRVTASEGVYRIPLESDSVTAILTLDVDGYLCEKPYTFDIVRRGTLATPDRVVDYLCAPSQYTNIAIYGMYPEETLIGAGESSYSSVKSLGNFGGYITYYYENAINNSSNNPYGVDFIVYANSNGGQGFSEPGNVLVSQDGETWYSLAGSDHFDDNVIWNYPVTYTKQADGKAGYSHAYGAGVWGPYPNWNNYPLTENRGDSFTLIGSLITGEGGKDEYGSNEAPYPDWGYADVSINGAVNGNAFNPYDKGLYSANGFDLDWAVDADGQPVKLDSVNYVKVETASFILAGAIGEKSTEVNCVVKTNASASEVGVTPAPQSIAVNGKAVNLEAGVNSYDVKLDSLNSAFAVAVDAPEGSNIYINSQRGASREFEKAPREKIVRVIVQEGEKEPAIYYLNLSENQPEPENTPPVLKEGVGPTAEAEVTVGTAYELDLSTIFEDADSDELNYSVSVDGADAVSADTNYSYTPSETGTYTLVFKANDGKADSETYTVVLTVREDTSGEIEEAQKVDDLIAAISDPVTLADKAKIEKARAAYDALSSAQAGLVSNYQTLTAAEAKLADLLKPVQDVQQQIEELPAAIGDTEAEMLALYQASRAFDELTAEQKAALSPDLQAKLAALQKQAAEINHTSNGVQIQGLPWNIILTAEPIKGGADYEAMKKEAENKLGTDRTILGMYDLTLQKLTADGLVEYLLDGETTTTITITIPDLAKYKEIKIIHQLADGSYEYIEPLQIEGNQVTFTVKSLSNYAIVGQLAKKDTEPAATPGDEQGKPSTEDKGKKAPKTGDFNSGLPALLLLFALCAGGYLYCRRGKEENRL